VTVSKETENANPFEGFISSETLDGEIVQPSAAAAAAGRDDKQAGKAAAEGKTEIADAGAGGAVSDAGRDNKKPAEDDAKKTTADDKTAAGAGDEHEDAGVADQSGEDDTKKTITVAEAKKMASRAAQGRVNAMRIKQTEAERRAEAAEQRLAALERGDTKTQKDHLTTQTAAAKDEGKPDPDKYKYGVLDDQYQSDLATFNVEKAWAAKQAQEDSTRQTQAAEREAQEFAKRAEATLAKGAAKYDDFQALVVEGAANNEWPLSETLGKLIVQSEVGADIAYHLASNPKEAREVAGKTPLEQAAYFGRLEARFSADPAAKKPEPEPQTPKLPPPPKQPRGAGGKFVTSPDTEDFSAFEALANQQ